MIRVLLGILILGGMSSAGYVLIRPRIHRPTISVGAHLDVGDPPTAAVALGARLALAERDGRGGAFDVRHFEHTTSYCEADRDNSNSSYASLGLREPQLHLPGFAEPGQFFVGGLGKLPLDEDGSRAVQAFVLLGKRSVVLLTPEIPRRVKPKIRIVKRSRNGDEPAEQGFAAHARDKLQWSSSSVFDPLDGVLEASPEAVYLLWALDGGEIARHLRNRGYSGEILIPSAYLIDSSLEGAEGCLTLLARVAPPSPDFARRCGSADPFAHAAYRSCRQLLDALDRARARTFEEAVLVAAAARSYHPFADPEVATVGVYRIRAGRFELVRNLP